MAPLINPNPIMAPIKVVLGINMSTEAINSPMPVPIRPQGSMPSLVNNWTDSGCAVNLKYNVCNIMKAATSLNAHVKIVFVIILQCYGNPPTNAVVQMTFNKVFN